MTKLDEIREEIKRLEADLKKSDDYNEQWKISHNLKDLYKKQYDLERRGFK